MSIFSIGLSGLNAARTAFNTTSNNIANVSTPGYNREITVLTQDGATQGVKVAGVQRQFDTYIASQLNAANSKASGLDAYQTQVSQIDNLLADQDAGLAPLMQKFYSAVSTLAGSPSNPAARQGVIGQADTLSAQFRSFDQYLADMASGLNGQLNDQVTQVNNTATQIAALNKQISLAAAKLGHAPNGLLDQRDQLVSDLSKRVNIQATQQENGTYNISIGNGQPLVAGDSHFSLQTVASAADPTNTVIGYKDSAGNLIELPDSTFSGGTLGGLLTFRDESLNPTRNQLGQLAVSFAEAVNTQHAAGFDLDGDAGAAMFAVGAPQAFANARNTGTASVGVAFNPAETDQLTADDYQLKVTDAASGTFELANLTTGVKQSLTLPATTGATVAQTAGASNAIVTGDATYDTTAPGFGTAFTIEFNSPAAPATPDQYSLDGGATWHAYAAGDTISHNGVTLTPSGTPAAGDQFAITSQAKNQIHVGGVTVTIDNPANLADNDRFQVEPTRIAAGGFANQIHDTDKIAAASQPDASGNNENALALEKLQTEVTVGGTSSFNQAYANIVSSVGSRTNIVKVNLAAQQSLADQLTQVQQSQSGVNLDEEAMNLVQSQQFYQANAKVIQTGSSILETILSIQ